MTPALTFYADHDRIRPAATRDETLDAMVEHWAGDVDAGHDTAMFAWRRAKRGRSERPGAGHHGRPAVGAGADHRWPLLPSR